jgi:hypothetical protein
LRKSISLGLRAQILRGRRHLVWHDGRDVQDMREEIVADRYAAGAGDHCRLLHRARDDIRVPSTSSIGP